MSNGQLLKTDGFESRLESFCKGIGQIEELAEKETFAAIEELMDMGTIKNWPALVRLVIGKMKAEMQAKITRINEARESVNR